MIQCIKKDHDDFITINKYYDLIKFELNIKVNPNSKYHKLVWIIDDNGNNNPYFAKNFLLIPDVRNNIIDELLK